MANNFPLPKSPDQNLVLGMSKRYNLYTNVLSMSLGQFILLENAIKSSEPEYNISSLIIRPIDEDRFESVQCQETDYNFNDVIYDSVTFKSRNIIRDFEIDGLLTLAFPCVFSNA